MSNFFFEKVFKKKQQHFESHDVPLAVPLIGTKREFACLLVCTSVTARPI